MTAPGETAAEDLRNAMAMLSLARQLDDAAYCELEGERSVPGYVPVQIERATLVAVMERLASALEKIETRAPALGL